MDWTSLAYSPELQARFMRMAVRTLHNESLAEQAIDTVLESLSENNWEKLNRAYSGRGSPEGYLTAIMQRGLIDFSRERFGYLRPPRWIQKLGALWVEIFKLLCGQRIDPETIKLKLHAIDEYRRLMDERQIEDAIREVRGKVTDCGQYIGEADHIGDDWYLIDQHATNSGLDAALEQEHAHGALNALQRAFNNPGPVDAAQADDDALSARLTSAIATLNLCDDERLVLRLVFQEGKSISEAARILGEKDHTVRRRQKTVLQRLREVFAQYDIHQLNEVI